MYFASNDAPREPVEVKGRERARTRLEPFAINAFESLVEGKDEFPMERQPPIRSGVVRLLG